MDHIYTSRLLIRPIVSTDIQHVFEGLSHPDVIRYYGVSYQTIEETQEQMEWYAELEKNSTGQWWAICDKDTAAFMGAIGVYAYQSAHYKAEFGYWLLPDYWNKGYIKEAAEVILEKIYDLFLLNRLEATVEPENIGSKKVLKYLGFEYEGTMRQTERKNGKWIDLEMYGRLFK